MPAPATRRDHALLPSRVIYVSHEVERLWLALLLLGPVGAQDLPESGIQEVRSGGNWAGRSGTPAW
jgi:hypothetical protein